MLYLAFYNKYDFDDKKMVKHIESEKFDSFDKAKNWLINEVKGLGKLFIAGDIFGWLENEEFKVLRMTKERRVDLRTSIKLSDELRESAERREA